MVSKSEKVLTAKEGGKFLTHKIVRNSKSEYIGGEVVLPTFVDDRGRLTKIESGKEVPFAIRRVFFLYDCTQMRGGHKNRTSSYLVVPVSGSFDLRIRDDDTLVYQGRCRNPRIGFHILPGVSVEIDGFSKDAVCMVLCSDYYGEESYGGNFPDPWKNEDEKS